ncbi:MAG TPA: transglycosylase SLT domain-containing protein [Myxococcales bacterium]
MLRLSVLLALTGATAAASVQAAGSGEIVDLRPHFAEGARARARQAYAEGRFGEAQALLTDQGDDPPVRYLRALCELGAGHAEQAAEALARLAPNYLPMRDRLHLQSAAAFEQASRWKAAADQYGRVEPSSLVFAEARLGQARTLRRQGQLPAAIEALAPLLAMPEPEGDAPDRGAQALWAQVELAEAAKDSKLRSRTLLRLWSEHPRAEEARRAQPLLPSARQLPVEAMLSRAERLVATHRNVEGIAELEPLRASLHLPDSRACRAHFALADALRKERRHREAIALYEPVVEGCADGALRARALFSLATSRSIATPEAAPALFDRLLRDFPDFRPDEARFASAMLDLRAGKVASARARFEELSTTLPRTARAPEALFRLFWLERSAGAREPSLIALDRLSSACRGPGCEYERQRAEYWHARTLGEGSDDREELGNMERLAFEHRGTFYGALALRRLDSRDPERAAKTRAALGLACPRSQGTPPTPSAPPAKGLAGSPRLATAVELLRLGFTSEARSELRALPRPAPRDSALLLAHLLALAGDPGAAHLLVRTSLGSEQARAPSADTRALWELAYPRAYRPLIERHCAEAGVDPDLLQALIREESALDPQARSWAGALGLTQLLPGRGERVARALGLPGFEPEDLFEPDTSIRLGCAHLGALLREFDGEIVYAFAAYNAEPERIHRWLRQRPGRPIDEFIEEIPIDETRGYVKRLLRSVEAYRLLYGPGAGR